MGGSRARAWRLKRSSLKLHIQLVRAMSVPAQVAQATHPCLSRALAERAMLPLHTSCPAAQDNLPHAAQSQCSRWAVSSHPTLAFCHPLPDGRHNYCAANKGSVRREHGCSIDKPAMLICTYDLASIQSAMWEIDKADVLTSTWPSNRNITITLNLIGCIWLSFALMWHTKLHPCGRRP